MKNSEAPGAAELTHLVLRQVNGKHSVSRVSPPLGAFDREHIVGVPVEIATPHLWFTPDELAVIYFPEHFGVPAASSPLPAAIPAPQCPAPDAGPAQPSGAQDMTGLSAPVIAPNEMIRRLVDLSKLRKLMGAM